MEALGAGVTAAMQALLAGKNAEGASRAAELAIGQAEAAALGYPLLDSMQLPRREDPDMVGRTL